jgi:purine-binding chemotaxis protein CheW
MQSAQTMRQAQNPQEIHDADALQVLTFDLQGETFALDAGLVREVIDLAPETQVPGAAPFVDAVINFRGRVIPLADLRLAFGMGRAAASVHSRIVVIEHEIDGQPTLVGLRADKVHEVTLIPLAQTEEPPRVGLRWRADFIQRLAKHGDALVVIPDLAQVFATRGGATGAVVPFASV